MGKRICKVCGAAYNYCPDCLADVGKPAYMVSFDKENCKKIWDALCEYGVSKATKEETVKKLKELALSDSKNFNPGVKHSLDAVLGGNTKASSEPVAEKK